MPRLLTYNNDSFSRLAHFPDWLDTIELDSADAQTYTVPNHLHVLLIQPVLQSSGVLSTVYAVSGTGTLHTTAVGEAFTNQPATDTVEVVSSDNGDTTQTITIYYTDAASGDTLRTETKALNGTTQVVFDNGALNNISLVLAVKKSAATIGTVTFREGSGNATIVQLAPTDLSAGVETVSPTDSGGRLLQLVASGATTKQFGIKGTNAAGTTIYDSQALTGTTSLFSNSRFFTVTEVYTGDLENNRTVTVTKNIAALPTEDHTDGASALPITAPAFFSVDGGTGLSFIRVAAATVNVEIAGWSKKVIGANS